MASVLDPPKISRNERKRVTRSAQNGQELWGQGIPCEIGAHPHRSSGGKQEPKAAKNGQMERDINVRRLMVRFDLPSRGKRKGVTFL
jgi:hypothetical protein